jgi:hypothetical protein
MSKYAILRDLAVVRRTASLLFKYTSPGISAAASPHANLRMFEALTRMSAELAAFCSNAVIAAPGNENRTTESPDFKNAASLPTTAVGVASIGALQRRAGEKYSGANFSNTFAQIALPDVNVLSAKAGGGSRNLSDASMTCSHVAALWWEALRKSGIVNPSAQLLFARLLAAARTDGSAPGVVIADRGAGLVTSPP